MTKIPLITACLPYYCDLVDSERLGSLVALKAFFVALTRLLGAFFLCLQKVHCVRYTNGSRLELLALT